MSLGKLDSEANRRGPEFSDRWLQDASNDETGCGSCDERGDDGPGAPRGRVYFDARLPAGIQKLDPRVSDVLQSTVGVFTQRALEKTAGRLRQRCRKPRPVGGFPENFHERVRDRLAFERALARQCLVQAAPERPYICSPVESTSLPRACSRAHIARRSHDRPERRASGEGRRLRRCRGNVHFRCEHFRETEIEDLDLPVGCDLDVRRLQVAMNDPFLVSGFETFGDLDEQRLCFFKRNRPALDALCQRLPLDELHDKKLPCAGLFVTVERRDVRVIQRGQELRFTLEAVETFSDLGEIIGRTLIATSRPSLVSRAR